MAAPFACRGDLYDPSGESGTALSTPSPPWSPAARLIWAIEGPEMHALGKSSHHPALRPPRARPAAVPCVRAPPKGWYAIHDASKVQAPPDFPHRVPVIWCFSGWSTATRSTAGHPDRPKTVLTSTIGSGPRSGIAGRDSGRRGESGATIFEEVCLGHLSRGQR